MNDINLLDTPALQSQWIRSTFIEPLPRLVTDGYTMIAYMVIAQGIETMGAFIDKKPFKARGQGAARFALALEKLFPARYSSFNRRDFLYQNLRGNLTHLSVGSPHLILGTRADGIKHLWAENKKTSMVLEDLMEDFICAWGRVIEGLENGTIRVKPLVNS